MHFLVKLHIFNPEHDIALAYGEENITLPHTIQEFKMNLGYIPALWANDGDCILVDDVPYAIKALAKVHRPHADVVFVNKDDIKCAEFAGIEPWGWDHSLCAMLTKSGIKINGRNSNQIIDNSLLDKLRDLSNRKHTSGMLEYICKGIENITCGKSFYVTNFDNLLKLANQYKHIVIKAPWSSSGRGIRYVTDSNISQSLSGWAKNIIKRQGGLSVEPYYNRIKDFAMEFYSHEDGHIDYCGLSVFSTDCGTYTGNIIASESYKEEIISKYLSKELLALVSQRIQNYLSPILKDWYRGPFGIDMMVVGSSNGFILHPCVEINLRRTMGHVANSARVDDNAPAELMHIIHDVNYLLRFESIEKTFVKVI